MSIQVTTMGRGEGEDRWPVLVGKESAGMRTGKHLGPYSGETWICPYTLEISSHFLLYL